MADKNEIVPTAAQPTAVAFPQATHGMVNTGSGIQVGENAGTMNLNFNGVTPEMLQSIVSMFAAQAVPQKVSHALEWASLSTERFCLFVLENEEYNCGAFSIAKKCALQKYTHPAHKERFLSLSTEAITELIKMPCIFAKRNRDYKSTDASHPALLGRITAVNVQHETIKLRFTGFQAISQQVLNQNITLLGLAYSALRNELDEEHWSIKDGNLPGVMTRLNITVE